jgi:citrate lyase subunit beta/citryl-CoA lyase
MVETPRGVLGAPEIAGASPRLACLVAGTSDLVKDLGARHTPGRVEVLTALSLVVLAARAHGLAALDGVHLDLEDDAGFAAACAQGRDLGFDGKTLVHPRTIEAANRAFSPEPAEVDRARRVIAAHAEAERAGRGVVVVDGRLVEALHVEAARRLVALAEAVAARPA